MRHIPYGSLVTRASRSLLGSAAVLALLTWFGGLRVRLDYDEGVYAQTLRLVSHGHPLVTDVFTSQPPLWPFLALPGWVAGGVTGSRLWVMTWALIGLLAVYLVARHYTTASLSLLTAVLVAAVPAYSSTAVAIQADVPALALATAALALALQPGRSTRRLMVVGIALGLALMVKLLVVPMVVVVLLAAVQGASDRKQVVRDLAAVTGATAVVVLATGAAFWGHGELWAQAVGLHVASQGLLAGVKTNITTALQAPGTCVFLGLATLAAVDVVRQRRRDLALPVVWLVATLAFLLLHSPLFTHHLVLAVPPAALVLVLEARARLADRRHLLQAVLAGLVAVCLVGSATDDITDPALDNAHNNAAVAALGRLPVGTVLVTDDQALATAANRTVVGPLVDTSDVRIASGNLTPEDVCAEIAQAGAVLLTHGGRFDLLPQVAACTRSAMHVTWSGPDGTLYVRP